jgi:hypothetical protein
MTAFTVMPCKLDAGGAHEAELAGLRGAIVRPAGKSGHRSGDRRGQHDARLIRFLEIGHAGLHRQKAAFQVAVRKKFRDASVGDYAFDTSPLIDAFTISEDADAGDGP